MCEVAIGTSPHGLAELLALEALIAACITRSGKLRDKLTERWKMRAIGHSAYSHLNEDTALSGLRGRTLTVEACLIT